MSTRKGRLQTGPSGPPAGRPIFPKAADSSYDRKMPDSLDKADAPVPSGAAVSAQMRRMPRRDSTGEVRLCSELHRLGLRFRKHLRGLPGTPDIALTRAQIAVFFDGCFWHCCPDHGVFPKSNRAWWKVKLDGNVARDRRNDMALTELGWLSFRVWEHEDPVEAALRVAELWRTRTGR